MAENIVSSPPLTAPVVDASGKMSRPWSIFFRDIYKRTSYKGGNAIDDNVIDLDITLETLGEAIDQIVINANVIASNSNNLTDHEGAEQAHGSNGNVVGFNDLATTLSVGLVKQMESVSNASNSSASVTSPNATLSSVSITSPSIATAPATYDQTFIDTIVTLVNELKLGTNQIVTDVNPTATLANELKADVNQIVSDINASIAQLNELLANSKASGQMET